MFNLRHDNFAQVIRSMVAHCTSDRQMLKLIAEYDDERSDGTYLAEAVSHLTTILRLVNSPGAPKLYAPAINEAVQSVYGYEFSRLSKISPQDRPLSRTPDFALFGDILLTLSQYRDCPDEFKLAAEYAGNYFAAVHPDGPLASLKLRYQSKVAQRKFGAFDEDDNIVVDEFPVQQLVNAELSKVPYSMFTLCIDFLHHHGLLEDKTKALELVRREFQQ